MDLKNIELLEDVPYRITIMNDIKPNIYEFEEKISRIDSLLDEYRITRKKFIRTGKDSLKVKGKKLYDEIVKIYKDIKTSYSLAPDIDFENYFLIDNIKEELENLKDNISYRFKPINLEGRTSQLLIVGRDNKISNINVEKTNNAALFNNVGCELTIVDLEFSNIRVNGVNNVALLVCGNNSDNCITLSDVGIHGSINGVTNVSEIITSTNGFLNLNGVEYRIVINGTDEKK